MPKPARQLSTRARDLLIEWESLRLRAYVDQAGKLTIGVGHCLTQAEITSDSVRINGVDVYWRDGLTIDECHALLDQDLDIAEHAVCDLVSVLLAEHQFDALVMFVFNVGVPKFKGSTLRKRLNAGEYAAVPAQMKRWVHVTNGGVKSVSPGLKNRRNKEVWLWNGGIGPLPAPVRKG